MAAERTGISVIVPFAGSPSELDLLRRDLQRLSTRSGDEVIIADNRGQGTPQGAGIRVCTADRIHTPAFARNHAARSASGEWLVFIDADTEPAPRLLDAYFEPPPQDGTGVLAGGVEDVAVRPTLVARHSVERAQMNQQVTLTRTGTPYAQTANCAVRRDAFDAVGGFDEHARAGEDADLCFRLRQAGWQIEERPAAIVRHRSRTALGAWLAQQVRHGSGAAWVNRRWPGEFPSPGPLSLVRRFLTALTGAFRHARGRDLNEAAFLLLDLAGECAFDLGRLVSNHRGA